jgi:hypothetical protein
MIHPRKNSITEPEDTRMFSPGQKLYRPAVICPRHQNGMLKVSETDKEIVFKIKPEGAMVDRVRLQELDRKVCGRQGRGRQPK